MKLIIGCSFFFVGAAMAASPVTKICESGGSHSSVRRKMADQLIPDAELRPELNQLFASGQKNKCSLAVSDYMDFLLKDYQKASMEKGKSSFVLLGLLGKMPSASLVLSKEIEEGKVQLEWLQTLQETNGQLFFESLEKYFSKIATQLREEEFDLEKRNAYFPIIFDKYLTDAVAAKKVPATQELRDLDAIYGGLSGNSRGLIEKKLAEYIQPADQEWVKVTRGEPTKIQLRLFSLYPLVGGAEVVKELMWLSQHHFDGKVRVIAGKTFEDMTQPSNPSVKGRK